MPEYLGEIIMPPERRIKLDKTNQMILQILIENARTPLSVIAKKVRLSKPSVLQRIETMKKKKLMLDSIILTNPFAWGYKMFFVYLKIHPTNQEESIKLLRDMTYLAELLYFQGKYNILIIASAPDFMHFSKVWHSVLEKITVKDWAVSEINAFDFIPYNTLKGEYQLEEEKGRKLEIKPLTKDEAKVLHYLRTDVRASYATLSQKTKLSPDKVKRILHSLYKRRVIHRYFTNYDFYSLGWRPFMIMFKTPSISSRMRNYFLMHHSTNGIYSMSDEWSLMVVAQFRDLREQRLFLEEALTKFPEIEDYEILTALEQLVCDYFPQKVYEETRK